MLPPGHLSRAHTVALHHVVSCETGALRLYTLLTTGTGRFWRSMPQSSITLLLSELLELASLSFGPLFSYPNFTPVSSWDADI
jgi:hypothetical protein